MAEPKRLKRAASSGWLVGCCAVAVSLLLGARAFAVVTITVGTTNGVQGGELTLTMGVERLPSDPLVSGAQIDILFNTMQIELAGSCACPNGGLCPNAGAPCQANTDCGPEDGDNVCVPQTCEPTSAVNPGDFTAILTPTVRPPDQPPSKRLRLLVGAVATPNAIYEGDLATCRFHVRSDAVLGPVSLMTDDTRLQASDPDTNPIPVEAQLMPGVILMATPTPTPTPPIPCFVDQDCPRGQVCENKVCVPAPTPTPTIACPDGICPDGLTCVDGICRDLSTPTPTPTPLPTCTTDQDCIDLEGPGFHCRAGVCVPERPCDESSACRGFPRESCVDNTCECLGDCNLDGKVLGNESSIMTCILRGECPPSDCPAGGADGDGQVTGSDLCLALYNLGLGCPAEGQPLVRDRTDETRSLDIGSASGPAGTEITLGVSLGLGGEVATAQLDLLIDTSLLELPDVTKDCTVDPRLQVTEAIYTYEPQTPGTPPGVARLRLFVGNTDLCKPETEPPYPLSAFDPGPLVSCKFRINPNAQPGTYEVTADRLNIGDPQGAVFGSVSTPGSVTVEEPPPCVTDADCPQGTHCRAGVCKPLVECTDFAQCGTSGRDSCVEGICECGGDCNLDGVVTVSEIGTAVEISGDALMVSACLAADQKGDGRVTVSDIGVSVTNSGLDCPTP
jgi:hypothetical protein